MRRKRLVRWLGATTIVLAIGVAITRPSVLTFAAHWLDVGRPPQKADAVVLLNGGYNTRPFVAAALVHGGWAPKLIVNSVAPHAQQSAGVVPQTSDVVAKVLDYGGVPRDRVVLLPTSAATTYDETKAVATYLAANPVRRILIVTEGPHTRRAEWIFRRTLANQPVEISMVSAPTDEFDAATWWQCEAGFLFVVSEYFKLFFYAMRYGWLGYEIAGIGAILIAYATIRRRRGVA